VLAISLQSGSNGNSFYVETNGAKLLFDAGICGSKAASRLSSYGRDIRDVDALIISHDHTDHVSSAGVYQRKYGLPIFITPLTLQESQRGKKLGKLHNVTCFQSGDELRFGNVSVQTIPTPHDGVDGSAFVISSGDKRLGILTDLGHVFAGLSDIISSLDAVFIESNYDPAMLSNGPYPAFLKKRIQSPKGHLSNRESAELLQAGGRLKWACLAHLSECNNSLEVALRTHLDIAGSGLTFHTAGRHMASEIFTL
jgi:phosphoribosyl 1,2-cyclic phosphodiesterase